MRACGDHSNLLAAKADRCAQKKFVFELWAKIAHLVLM